MVLGFRCEMACRRCPLIAIAAADRVTHHLDSATPGRRWGKQPAIHNLESVNHGRAEARLTAPIDLERVFSSSKPLNQRVGPSPALGDDVCHQSTVDENGIVHDWSAVAHPNPCPREAPGETASGPPDAHARRITTVVAPNDSNPEVRRSRTVTEREGRLGLGHWVGFERYRGGWRKTGGPGRCMNGASRLGRASNDCGDAEHDKRR